MKIFYFNTYEFDRIYKPYIVDYKFFINSIRPSHKNHLRFLFWR